MNCVSICNSFNSYGIQPMPFGRCCRPIPMMPLFGGCHHIRPMYGVNPFAISAGVGFGIGMSFAGILPKLGVGLFNGAKWLGGHIWNGMKWIGEKAWDGISWLGRGIGNVATKIWDGITGLFKKKKTE